MFTLEELKEYPKSIDITLEDVSIIAESDGDFSKYRYKIGERDGHYYLFDSSDDYSHAREIALFKEYSDSSLHFDYTPDDIHRWYISCKRDTRIALKPEVRNLNVDQIEYGMSCSFKGITLTINSHDSVTIEMNGKSRTMKVEEDREFIYKFMKTKIKARNGAEGFYAHMEQVAEQSKVESHPLFAGSFEMMERLFTDPKLMSKKQQMER